MQPLDDFLCDETDSVATDSYQQQIDYFQPMATSLRNLYTRATLSGGRGTTTCTHTRMHAHIHTHARMPAQYAHTYHVSSNHKR